MKRATRLALKFLRRLASSFQETGLWISSTGKVIDIGWDEHVDWVRQYPQKFGLRENQVQGDDPMWEAYLKGWCRVRIHGSAEADVETITLNQAVFDVLWDIASKNTVSRWFIDLMRTDRTVVCSNEELKLTSTPRDLLKIRSVG